MKARPILFSGPMVRALLNGSKTQTRRACKDQTASKYSHVTNWPVFPEGEDRYTGWVKDCGHLHLLPTKCPYGQPGDLLWVRETFSILYGGCDRPDNIVEPWFPESRTEMPPPSKLDPAETSIIYLADDETSEMLCYPSIYMPKWASRLTLEITEVRAQRLQDISVGDAKAEGAPKTDVDGVPYNDARAAFICLWDRLNFKRGFGWGKNPWVWALTFKVHHRNILDMLELGND